MYPRMVVVLPHACETVVVVTMGLRRELRRYVRVRIVCVRFVVVGVLIRIMGVKDRLFQ